MTHGIPKHFINTMANNADRTLDIDKKYSCQNCYRKDLPAEMIAYLSHGEAYCKACEKAKE